MDTDRRIRFLIAPLLFLASLGWGAFVNDPHLLKTLDQYLPANDINKLISVATAGGVAVFTLGVVIGTISYVVLRGISTLLNKTGGVSTHEFSLSDDALKKLWKRIECPKEFTRSLDFYAAMSFDHGTLYRTNRGVHQWMVRRWNGFSIGVTSVTGLICLLLSDYLFR
jgi:hypothetical protein